MDLPEKYNISRFANSITRAFPSPFVPPVMTTFFGTLDVFAHRIRLAIRNRMYKTTISPRNSPISFKLKILLMFFFWCEENETKFTQRKPETCKTVLYNQSNEWKELRKLHEILLKHVSDSFVETAFSIFLTRTSSLLVTHLKHWRTLSLIFLAAPDLRNNSTNSGFWLVIAIIRGVYRLGCSRSILPSKKVRKVNGISLLHTNKQISPEMEHEPTINF